MWVGLIARLDTTILQLWGECIVRKSEARIRAHIAACLIAGIGVSASAFGAIVNSGPVDIVVPNNIDGIYFNVVNRVTGSTGSATPGWDINIYSSTPGQFTLWGPTAQTWLSTSGGVAGPYRLADGTSISAPDTNFFRPGSSLDAGPQLNADSDENLLGFRFINESGGATHYGWARFRVGATPATRSIVGYAWDDTPGALIRAGDTGEFFNSGPVSIPIPDNLGGIYFNVVTGAFGSTGASASGWDVNLYSETATEFNIWGPTAQTWLSLGGTIAGPYNLPENTQIGGTPSTFFRPGNTGVGAQFNLNSSNNLLGFRFINEANAEQVHFGWLRLAFGASVSERTIVAYGYDRRAGVGVLAGATISDRIFASGFD